MMPLVASLLWAALPPAPQKAPSPALVEQVRTAGERARQGDCRTALDIAAKIAADKGFDSLPNASRASVLEIAGGCAGSLGDLDLAYRTALAATLFPESSDHAWRLRLGLELQGQRREAAVTTVERLAATRPTTLNRMDPRWLGQIERELEQAGDTALRRRLLPILSADTYRPEEPGITNVPFRQRYAVLLHDAGDRAGALAIVRAIDEPTVVIDLSLDPRFRAAFPTDPDIRALAERSLLAARDLAARRPDAIGPVLRVTAMLRALGRPREALAVLEGMRAKVEGDAPLVDRDQQTVWWWDEIARADGMLGDVDGALAALRRGAMMAENGGANVSQTINLAGQQLSLGRPRDVLTTLGALGPESRGLSSFGTMQAMSIRGCAQARVGTPADAREALAYVRAHAADAPAALTMLLLCVGDEDGAASSLLARLRDDDERVEALRALSTFDTPLPGSQPDPDTEKLLSLGKRQDVQAAVTAAGGTRRFNIQDVSF